jgi:hypothetical protein
MSGNIEGRNQVHTQSTAGFKVLPATHEKIDPADLIEGV